MTDWPLVRIGDVTTWLSGGTPRKTEPVYWEGGSIPWISAASLKEERLTDSDRSVTAAAIGNGTRLAPRDSTLVLVRGMSLLEEIRVGRCTRELAFNQDVKALVPLEGVIDAAFLTYALLAKRPEILGMVHQAGHGTGVLATERLKNLAIGLPDLHTQRRISGALEALDDLVAIDAALVRELDHALMATWAAAARDSRLARFGDLASLSKGISYKGEFLSDSGLPLINLGNFGLDGSFRVEGSKHYQGPVRADRILRFRDLVVANTDLTQQRDILARPLLVPFEEATSTHHTFQVKVMAGSAMTAWLYCALRVEPLRRSLIAYSTGTTVAALPEDALSSVRLPFPNEAVLDRWWSQAEVLLDAQESLKVESRQAKATRDELLPLLMSGRIRPEEVAA